MKFFTILLLFALILSGCSGDHHPTSPSGRIVASVDIYCQQPSGTMERHYTHPGKLEAVLHYLRLLDPVGPIQVSPDAMQGDLYEIVVHLENGSVRVHRQRSDTFAALHQGYWGRIDRSLGLRLHHLMALLPSDDVNANHTDIPKKDITTS